MGLLTRLIPGWAILVAIFVGLASVVSLYYYKDSQVNKLSAELSQFKTEAAVQLAVQTQIARDAELELHTSTAQIREETYEKITSLTTDRNALLRRLRDARQATANACVPQTTSDTRDGQATRSGDEPELLGQLGEEDVLEASRAETIRLHLAACYRQYDRVKTALEAMSKGKTYE